MTDPLLSKSLNSSTGKKVNFGRGKVILKHMIPSFDNKISIRFDDISIQMYIVKQNLIQSTVTLQSTHLNLMKYFILIVIVIFKPNLKPQMTTECWCMMDGAWTTIGKKQNRCTVVCTTIKRIRRCYYTFLFLIFPSNIYYLLLKIILKTCHKYIVFKRISDFLKQLGDFRF